MKILISISVAILAMLSAPAGAQDACLANPLHCLVMHIIEPHGLDRDAAEARRLVAEREATNARTRAQLPGPAETTLCAGRMTRDGCQPK